MMFLLFYKTLGRKDGLIVFLKSLKLTLQLKTGGFGARSKHGLLLNHWRYLAFAAARL